MIQHFDPRRSYGTDATADQVIDELVAKLNEVITAVNELTENSNPKRVMRNLADALSAAKHSLPTHNED